MDLGTVTSVRLPHSRDDLELQPGETFLGGGTWLYSEPQPATTGLVDLTALGWKPIEKDGAGIRVAATCTIAELSRIKPKRARAALPLVLQCCNAFLASFKVWNVATVGGNLCMALPAGPMISLATALDAELEIWATDGSARTLPAQDFVTGNRQNALLPGEVLRSIRLPRRALEARTAFRKIALSPLGRSAAVVIGRVDTDGAFTLSVTAATDRPYVFRFEHVPPADALADHLDAITSWFDDPHGAPEWRRAMAFRLAEEVRVELGGNGKPPAPDEGGAA